MEERKKNPRGAGRKPLGTKQDKLTVSLNLGSEVLSNFKEIAKSNGNTVSAEIIGLIKECIKNKNERSKNMHDRYVVEVFNYERIVQERRDGLKKLDNGVTTEIRNFTKVKDIEAGMFTHGNRGVMIMYNNEIIMTYFRDNEKFQLFPFINCTQGISKEELDALNTMKYNLENNTEYKDIFISILEKYSQLYS